MLYFTESNSIWRRLPSFYTPYLTMKMIFVLLLALYGFIEISNGQSFDLKKLDKAQAIYHARNVESHFEKLQEIKKCPEHERKAREKCLVEDLVRSLKVLSLDLGCTLDQLFKLLDIPLNVLELVKLNKIEEILNVLKVEHLLKSLTIVLEALLAQIGIVLKTLITTLTQSLNTTLDLVSLDFLHGTLQGIVASLSGNLLGSLLSIPLNLVAALPILG